MSVVVCAQLGPVMGDQAISIAEAKNETPEARTRSFCICTICSYVSSMICTIRNNVNEYEEYGIKYVKYYAN
jgi:hypothetical protein